MTAFVVWGPPCAGKSTYVSEHRSDDDVRIDYDLIAQALGATVAHGSTGIQRRVAFAAREAAISAALKADDGDAWIIHTNPAPEALQRYADAGAKFIEVNPGIDECVARAKRDKRPADTIAAIEAWFDDPPTIPTPSKHFSPRVRKNMDMRDLSDAVAGTVREYVARSVTEITARLDFLDVRIADIPAGERGPQGEPGISVKADDVLPVLVEEVRSAISALPVPVNGVDGKDGASFLGGIGPPKVEGRSGDFYLDTQTGDIYRRC